VITTLLNAPLFTKNTHRDTFYVRKEEDRFYIGHYHGQTKDKHEVRISENFYNDFLCEKEKIKNKFDMMIKQKL